MLKLTIQFDDGGTSEISVSPSFEKESDTVMATNRNSYSNIGVLRNKFSDTDRLRSLLNIIQDNLEFIVVNRKFTEGENL